MSSEGRNTRVGNWERVTIFTSEHVSQLVLLGNRAPGHISDLEATSKRTGSTQLARGKHTKFVEDKL